MKRKGYRIERNTDKTITLCVGNMSVTFQNDKTLASFARQLHEQMHDRYVGMFKLQDADYGRVNCIFNKGDKVISFKDYETGLKFSMAVLEDIENGI